MIGQGPDKDQRGATLKDKAFASFAGAGLLVLVSCSSQALADGGGGGEITVSCNVGEKTAVIFSGDTRSEHPNATLYPVKEISQYLDNRRPTVVCAFPGATVSVKGGSSEEHPRNNNVTIYVNGVNTYDRLWLYKGGEESIKFSEHRVETRNCQADDVTAELVCDDADAYATEFKVNKASHPSFSCASAMSVVDILICDDDALADADTRLAEAYKAVIGNSKIVADEKMWLSARGRSCGLLDRGLYPVDVDEAKACLLKSYEGQITELKKAAPH